MKTNKLLFFVIALSIIIGHQSANAQISKGGIPPSFSSSAIQDSIPIVQMPSFNIDSLIQSDTATDFSFRFGYAIDVNMGLHNSGTWDTLQNGDKIWRLKISSANAFSINLIYDDFWLPEGSQFFVYNEDKSMILGAFTSDLSNNSYDKFATDLVKGSITVLEYFEPSYAIGGRLSIDKVIHAYVNTFSGHGGSASCNIDVSCSQGSEWCVEKRAASMILVDNNTRWCSGCLINNVRQDLTPYYLTANHCLRGDESTWIFRFKYWSPTCNQGDDAGHWVGITGSTVRANWSGTDFALLQLNAQPPSGFGVLYAGWFNQNIASPSGASITHPRGDVMKIGLYNQTITQQTFLNSSDWRVVWSQGTVEPGSSGGPLFNNEHLLIGQVHGGNTSDICTSNDHAFFGRFDLSWNGGGTSATRLRDWLDPDNTGATSVGATSPTIYLINRTLTGTHKFAALDHIHIEGEVITGHPFFGNTFCQTSGIPFTAEPGSNVEIKARSITIKPGTHFKAGSNVRITATNDIECSDNIVEGDYVNVFCNAQISMKMGGGGSYTASNSENMGLAKNNEEELSVVNLSDNITLYPNPNSRRFEIAFSDSEVKFYEILIYDMSGKIVYEKHSITENKVPIDICHLQKGTYIVQIIHSGNSHTKKIIIN